MKKIAMITYSINTHGGVQRVISNLSNELSSKGYKVDIFVTVQSDNESIYKLNDGINVYCILDNTPDFFMNIRKELIDYDVIIGHAAPYSALVSRLDIKAKKIGIQHNMFNIYYDNYYKDVMDIYLEYMKDLDCNIVLNNSDLKPYKERNIKSVRIPNFIYKKNGSERYIKEKVILAAGRMDSRESKGIDLLIHAFSKIASINPNWTLNIYGDGPKRKDYLKLINKYNLQNQINLKGFSDNLDKEMEKAGIFAMSSRWEGFPMVVLEAMEHSMPIVSFDIDGVIDLVKNEKNGLKANCFNIDEYANNLNKLMKDDDLRKSYGEKSKKIIKEFYSDDVINKWIELIEE